MESNRSLVVPAPVTSQGIAAWRPVTAPPAGRRSTPVVSVPACLAVFAPRTRSTLPGYAAALVRPFTLPRGESVALSRPV